MAWRKVVWQPIYAVLEFLSVYYLSVVVPDSLVNFADFLSLRIGFMCFFSGACRDYARFAENVYDSCNLRVCGRYCSWAPWSQSCVLPFFLLCEMQHEASLWCLSETGLCYPVLAISRLSLVCLASCFLHHRKYHDHHLLPLVHSAMILRAVPVHTTCLTTPIFEICSFAQLTMQGCSVLSNELRKPVRSKASWGT